MNDKVKTYEQIAQDLDTISAACESLFGTLSEVGFRDDRLLRLVRLAGDIQKRADKAHDEVVKATPKIIEESKPAIVNRFAKCIGKRGRSVHWLSVEDTNRAGAFKTTVDGYWKCADCAPADTKAVR